MAIAAIAGIGSLLASGATIASSLGARNRQPQQDTLARDQLDLTKQNVNYQQMLNALAMQRASAGYEDSQGSSLKFDPYTNKWTTQLGALPQQADTSALINTILRNTTDASQQRFANERAAGRAALAEPGADRAIRDFNTYQPVSETALSGLLTKQAADAGGDAYRGVLSDTLRQFARTGSSGAGRVIADVGSRAAKDLQDSMVKARLSGIQGAGEINKQRLGTLAGTAQTGSQLASPQFQQTPFQASNRGDILANMQASQQKTAALAPIYGAGNVNQALGQSGAATGTAISNVPNPNFDLNKYGEVGKQIGELTNKDSSLMQGLQSLFGGGSGGMTTGVGRTSALTDWTTPNFSALDTIWGSSR